MKAQSRREWTNYLFILPIFIPNKVFAVFLAEPISDILAALVTSTVFFTRFNKILAGDAKQA